MTVAQGTPSLIERLQRWIEGAQATNDTGVPLNGPGLIKLLQDCSAEVAALSAQVAELQQALKERGLFYAGREACILNARDAHQQRADRAEAQVVELQKDAEHLLLHIKEVLAATNGPEFYGIDAFLHKYAVHSTVTRASVPPSVKDSGTV